MFVEVLLSPGTPGMSQVSLPEAVLGAVQQQLANHNPQLDLASCLLLQIKFRWNSMAANFPQGQPSKRGQKRVAVS
jgi:hypothetical protein